MDIKIQRYLYLYLAVFNVNLIDINPFRLARFCFYFLLIQIMPKHIQKSLRHYWSNVFFFSALSLSLTHYLSLCLSLQLRLSRSKWGQWLSEAAGNKDIQDIRAGWLAGQAVRANTEANAKAKAKARQGQMPWGIVLSGNGFLYPHLETGRGSMKGPKIRSTQDRTSFGLI